MKQLLGFLAMFTMVLSAGSPTENVALQAGRKKKKISDELNAEQSKKSQADKEFAEREQARRYGLKEWHINGKTVFAATKKAAHKKAGPDAIEQGFGLRKAA
jgi:hypothetical protein